MNVIYPGYKGCETTTFELLHPLYCLFPPPSFHRASLQLLFSPFKRETLHTEGNIKGWAAVGVVKVEAPVNQRNIISLIQTPGCNGAECLRRVSLTLSPFSDQPPFNSPPEGQKRKKRFGIYIFIIWRGLCTERNHCLRLIGALDGARALWRVRGIETNSWIEK